MTDERNRELNLNRYWNAVVAGDEAADGLALEAEDTAVVDRLHRAASSALSSRRADEAWPAVLARISPAAAVQGEPPPRRRVREEPPAHFGPNGRAPHVAAAASGARPLRTPWRLVPGFLATAALIALTLTAGLFTIGPLRPAAPDAIAPLPAVEEPAGIAAGQFELLWQTKGGSEPFDDPFGLGVDPAGNLWVVEANLGRFEIFAPDGTFIEPWGEAGSGEGQFDFTSPHPHGKGDVAFDADGNIYVVDSGNFRVQKFAPDRRFLLSWGEEGTGDGRFLRPGGIAVDAEGAIYVSDNQRANVQKFDREGNFLGAFGSLGVEEGQLILPQGIAVDPRGMIWVVDRGNNRLQQFDSTGRVHAVVGHVGFDEGEFNEPIDVAIDRLGRLYVTEQGNGRVQALTPDGRVLATVGGFADNTLVTPLGVAVDGNGAVYVSDIIGVKAFRVLLPTSVLLTP